MDFIKLAAERYSVRKFSGRAVEKEKMDMVLRAGQLAPTAVNFQPQRILVIQSRERLERLKECTRYHFDAPAAILVCVDQSACWRRKYDGKSSGEIDASIVATHIMLEATEAGLGTTWVMSFDSVKIRDAYAIPENYEPVVLLPIGYPAADTLPAQAHTQRLPLERTVYYDAFSK